MKDALAIIRDDKCNDSVTRFGHAERSNELIQLTNKHCLQRKYVLW